MDIPSDQEQATAFLQSFKEKRNKISKDLEGEADVRLKVSQLRKQLVEAVAFLPSYDQRQCELQVSDLEKRMNQRRSTDTSKSRFVFKRGTLANKPRLVDIVRASADATPAPAPQGSEVTVDNTSQMKISGRSNETITLHSLYSIRRQEDQEKPISFLISHVGSCIIDLLPRVSTDAEAALEPLPITTVHIRDVKRTIVILPKVSGSVLLHDCFDSAIIIDCQQMRMHTSSNVNIFLHVSTIPVIEHCSNLRVGPYPTTLPRSASTSKHNELQDFDWIAEGPSPNWTRMDDSDIELQWDSARREWVLQSWDGELFGHDADREAALIAFTPSVTPDK